MHASYDLQPEPGLLDFMKQMGKILGTLIDKKLKKSSLMAVAKIARNVNATFNEIFELVFDAIQENLRYCNSMLVCQIIYESNVDSTQHGPKLIHSRGDADGIKEMMSYCATYHHVKSNQKPVQSKGDAGQLVWMLCKTRASDKKTQGPIHLISIKQDKTVLEPDFEYLESLQKLVAAMIQNSFIRKKRSQV